LSYKAGAGGSIGGPANQRVCGGASGFPVTAVPDDGYRFAGWSDGKKDAARTDAGGTAGVDVTANFVIMAHTLVYTAGQNGSLIGDAVMTVAHGGDGGMVLALADDGYEFAGWSDGVTDNPRTDRNVSADIAVSAAFDTLRHNVNYHVNSAHGSLAGSAAQRVAHGKSGSAVYVTGAGGYTFFEWSDGSKDSIRIDKNVEADIAVSAIFKDAQGNMVSVASYNREIPKANPGEGAAAIAPVPVLTGELTAGPNPTGKSSGVVKFFRYGSRVVSAALLVYDASGNAVKRVKINDKTPGGQSRRPVGSWDLTDAKGRPVGEGTYLVKGVIKTADKRNENVSLAVRVR
jgi:hypothetical protein